MQTADSAHPCAINIAGKRPHSHRLWHVHLSIQMGIPTGKVAYLSVMAQVTVIHGITTPISKVIYIYTIMISPFITFMGHNCRGFDANYPLHPGLISAPAPTCGPHDCDAAVPNRCDAGCRGSLCGT